ncbi:MAG: DNRLRE domain-containing protein [Acidobacteriota bacterium]
MRHFFSAFTAAITLGWVVLLVSSFTFASSVSIGWTASPDSTIIGYNVYRDDLSGAGYVRITGIPVSGLSYTDSRVQQGKSYVYAVTSVRADGVESVNSNSVQATVPCICTISPTSRSHGAGAESGTVSVTSASTCRWQVSASASWITLSTTSGVGSGTVSYSVLANTTSSTRMGSILIGDKSFSVTQAATAVRSVTFLPQHDARVNSANPTTNYGNQSVLSVKQATWNSYLKFSVTGLAGTVTRARIRLYVTDPGTSPGTAYRVSNYYRNTTAAWTARGLNWNNAPSMSGTGFAAIGKATTGTWVEFDVTPVISGNGTVSFGIKTSSADRVDFSSSEASQNSALLIIDTP